MLRCADFVKKLKSVITEAQKGLIGPDLNIHIFTGLCGVAGAGTFLDVCYILQHVLGNMGYAGKAFVTGFFFLPDVNISNYDTGFLAINGFASMKELDYAMNYYENGGHWEQQYDGFKVYTQAPPVHLACLISATDASGNILANGYDYAMHVVVDYVMEFIIREYPALPAALAAAHHPLTPIKTAGVTHDYCILGAANRYMPYKEILTYLASGIFAGFRNLNRQRPTDRDVEDFVKKTGLEYNAILRELTLNVRLIPLMEVDAGEIYEAAQGCNANTYPLLLKEMQDAQVQMDGDMQKKEAAMLNTNPVCGTAGQSEHEVSLIVKVRKQLFEIAEDPAKGPYYAAELLAGTRTRDLINCVEGYLTTCGDQLRQRIVNQSLCEESIKEALQRLLRSNRFNRGKCVRAYVVEWHDYFQNKAEIEKYQHLQELLAQFKQQLTELSEGFFSIFIGIMSELQETFDENLKTLAQPTATVSTYAEPLMTIQEDAKLKDSLDTAVKQMDIGCQIRQFVGYMLNHWDGWITQEEDKICAVVNRYFSEDLHEYGRRSLLYYLKQKYDTEQPDKLRQAVYNDIIVPLGKRSAPMFWNADDSILANAKTLAYLTIPNISDAITGAVQEYISEVGAVENVRLRSTSISDRISIFRLMIGIPLFAYRGVVNYLNSYLENSKRIPGTHLYERTSLDPRDNRLLPNIIPISRIAPEERTEEMKKALEDYDKAVELGVLSSTEVNGGKEYHLNQLDMETISRWTEELRHVVEDGNPNSIQVAFEQARERLQNLPVLSYQIIPNTGAYGYEELVIRDQVVGSLEHMQTIREQLQVVENYVDAIN